MSRIRVLVVEDDSIIRSCMVEALSDAGYEVDEAETGDLATKLLDEDGYRLVVTDLNMPGRFNGVDVAAYAHQHEPDLPFVFVTGRPDIRAHVFAADKIHGDDTTVPVLEPSLGRTRTGRLWVYVRDDRRFCGDAPPAAAYFYSPDRTAAHPAAHMTNFTGFLQADAYAGFEKLYGPARIKPGPIIEVACWAHTRRGFFEEWEHRKSPTAKEALDRIAAIYAIEARAARASIPERVALRHETAPLVEAFFAWAAATVAKLSAKSSLAGAFNYAINRREALSQFITDERLEVDNNIAENAMRCVALGRKNYLFAGSNAGGDRAASIYTLVQTAKLNGVNPEAYLRDTLTKIADGHPINKVDELMPWNMTQQA